MQVGLQFATANQPTLGIQLVGLGKPILPDAPFIFTISDLRFAISTACGLPRTAERPVSETVSLGGAIPLTPTNFNLLP